MSASAKIAPGLIVNADDLAIHPDTNAGIVSAYRNGIVSSATMLMTTPFVERTIRDVARAETLPIGVHLSLTLGSAVAPRREVADLVDEEGRFTWSSRGLLLCRFANGPERRLLAQIQCEFEAQLARACDYGMRPTHADSHQHVHMNPAIFAMLEEILPRFGIGQLRFSRESVSARAVAGALKEGKPINLAKIALLGWLSMRLRPRLATPDGFFGVLYSGVVTKQAVMAAIATLPTDRSLEICVHPGLPAATSEAVHRRRYENDFIRSAARQREHDILVDPELGEYVLRQGVALRSFDGREKAR